MGKKGFFLGMMLAFCNIILAQVPKIENPENADVMRSNGKIYVVVAVVLTILFGLFLYVFLTDRKISKLEKDIKNNNIQFDANA